MSNGFDTLGPGATTTEDGVAAVAALLLLSCTRAPSAGATLVSTTVLPVAVKPPTTDVAARFKAVRAGAVTVRVACLLPPLYVAVIVTALFAATVVEVMSNGFDTLCPGATTTEDGVAAVAASLLLSCTRAPSAGATLRSEERV